MTQRTLPLPAAFQPNKSILAPGVVKPRHLSARYRQHTILALDASRSMAGIKASSADAAARDLIAELAMPENKDGFELTVIDFGETASVAVATTLVTELQGSLKPLVADQSRTNIAAALRLAAEQNELLLAQPLERRVRLRSVVLLLSDGEHNAKEAVEPVAERLKKDADLVTVAFGDSADEKLLKEIASSEQHFFRCKDGRELRMFLAQVGKTLSLTMSQISRGIRGE